MALALDTTLAEPDGTVFQIDRTPVQVPCDT